MQWYCISICFICDAEGSESQARARQQHPRVFSYTGIKQEAYDFSTAHDLVMDLFSASLYFYFYFFQAKNTLCIMETSRVLSCLCCLVTSIMRLDRLQMSTWILKISKSVTCPCMQGRDVMVSVIFSSMSKLQSCYKKLGEK